MNQNPVGRSWMTMVKLNENELLMYGGFSGGYDALGILVKEVKFYDILVKIY
jgi:hypothetical protein